MTSEERQGVLIAFAMIGFLIGVGAVGILQPEIEDMQQEINVLQKDNHQLELLLEECSSGSGVMERLIAQVILDRRNITPIINTTDICECIPTTYVDFEYVPSNVIMTTDTLDDMGHCQGCL